MPIVRAPQAGSPLTTGDVLRDVPFAVITSDGKLSLDNSASYVMVVSRPCKAVRDDRIVIAPVSVSKIDLTSPKVAKPGDPESSLDRMRRQLAGVRDGGQYQDAFYLGNLDAGSNKRFKADLSALATVLIPTDAHARQQWVSARRVWSLDPEFCRDLHVRFFNVYARMGFDDYSWFPDPDLDVLVTEGESELNVARAKCNAVQRQIQEKEANSETVPEAMRSNLDKARASVATLEEQLAPYTAEKARRAP